MAYKFNPFTGTFDEVGTGGGGGVPDPLTLNELTVNTLLTADHIHGNLAGSVYIHVKNTDSVQLDAGTPFYITGTVGASDRVEIQAADSAIPAKGPAVGVLETTLAVNGEGNGVILGEIFNFDTATPGWSTNDELYVANGGGLTNVKPTSGYRQIVAYVGRIQASTGTLILTGTSIDPVAGSNGQIQFNDNGGFGADTGLSFDKATDQLTVEGDLNLGSGSSFSTTIQSVLATANRTISFPDQTGTVGLVSGATGNIQYNSSGALAGSAKLNTELNWTNAVGTYTGLKVNIDDGAGGAPLGTGNLLDLQINGVSKIKADFPNVTAPRIVFTSSGANATGVFSSGSNSRYYGWYAGIPVIGVDYIGLCIGSGALPTFFGTTATSGNRDTALRRTAAGVLEITDGATPTAGPAYFKHIPVAIANLPTPSATYEGAKGFVTDASVSTFYSIVAVGTNDGGSIKVPVFCDGTNWRIG